MSYGCNNTLVIMKKIILFMDFIVKKLVKDYKLKICDYAKKTKYFSKKNFVNDFIRQ